MRLDWYPGAVREAVMAAAKRLREYEIALPPLGFYRALADRAEEIAIEAIAEAIRAHTNDAESAVSNLRIVLRLLDEIQDDIFLATEQADDPTLARLAAYLLLEGNDGYNNLDYNPHWGAFPDPNWGTIWNIHENTRDLTPAFLFKVCMRGDVRFLAVECHAPNRRLPDEPDARLRARTMIVSGVPILVFSPAEIQVDAAGCVAEISSALAVLAQELLALHGQGLPPHTDFRPRAP
jgi:hypothetical protein